MAVCCAVRTADDMSAVVVNRATRRSRTVWRRTCG